jgi:hypothetical protein
LDEVIAIVDADAGIKLDAGAVAALEAWLPSRHADSVAHAA